MPDDQWLVFEFRAVALLDGSIEGVTIDMGDAEAFELAWPTSRAPPQRPHVASSAWTISLQSRHNARVMWCQQIL